MLIARISDRLHQQFKRKTSARWQGMSWALLCFVGWVVSNDPDITARLDAEYDRQFPEKSRREKTV